MTLNKQTNIVDLSEFRYQRAMAEARANTERLLRLVREFSALAAERSGGDDKCD